MRATDCETAPGSTEEVPLRHGRLTGNTISRPAPPRSDNDIAEIRIDQTMRCYVSGKNACATPPKSSQRELDMRSHSGLVLPAMTHRVTSVVCPKTAAIIQSVYKSIKIRLELHHENG